MATLAAALTAAAALASQVGSLGAAAQAFDDAQLHHDRRLVEAFLAPDFQYITRTGERLGREAFVANTTSPDEVLMPFIVSDHRVVPLGPDGGIASGDAIVRGSRNGEEFEDHFRYADVFSRRGGRWVVVYTQVTVLAIRAPAP